MGAAHADASARAQFTVNATAKFRIVKGVRRVEFVWPAESAGPCRLDVPSFVLEDSGKGFFQSNASTVDASTGGVWHLAIDLEDANGYYLFGVEEFASPVMTAGDPPPQFEYDQRLRWNPRDVQLAWGHIRTAQLHGTC
jgi:hypothetical protein